MLSDAQFVALTEVLDSLDREEYEMDGVWKHAHKLAQENEGHADFDWLHAMLHRIDGDTSNASYWYKSAGREPFKGSFRDEVRAMLTELKSREL